MARSTRAVVAKQKSVQTTWLRNAMKSVGISSKNVLKEIAPNIYEATEAGINTSKSVANAIRGGRTSSGNIARTLQNDKYVQFAQKAYRNAISDLKSGKFQNEDRFMEAFGSSTESDLQEIADGLTFGDDGTSSMNVNVIGDTSNTSGAILSLGDTLQRQTETNLKVQKANMDAYVSISAASMQQTGQIGAEIIGHLSSINSNLAAMVQYNNENMNRFIEASLAYYEKVGSTVANGNNHGGDGRITANDVLNGRNGGLNMNKYKAYVKQQLKDTVDKSNIGLIKSLLDDDMLDMLASNPLGFLSDGMLRYMAPKILTSTIQSVETTFSNVVPSALLEVQKWANDPKTGLAGTIKRSIGNIFGISLDKRTITRGNVSIERGAIPFDGETKHAITEIITKELRTQTSYLEIIASHYRSDAKRYARDNASHWDWNSGRYTNRQGINRSIAEEYVNSVSNSFNETRFGKSMQKLVNEQDNEKSRQYMEDALKEVYVAINRHEGDMDIKVLLDIISKTGLTNDAKKVLHKHIKEMATRDKQAYENLGVARIRARSAGEAARKNVATNASSYGYFSSDFMNVNDADEEDALIDEIMGYGGRKRRRRTGKFRNVVDYRDENPNTNKSRGQGGKLRSATFSDSGLKPSGKFAEYVSNTGAHLEGIIRSFASPNGSLDFMNNLAGLVSNNVAYLGEKASIILFGDKEGDKKGIFSDTIDSFKSTTKEMFSKVKNSLNEGIDSIMDSLMGSKTRKDKDGNIISRLDRVKNWIFGEKDDNGERMGGLIKKETQTFLKENKGSIALSTASGAITGGGLLGTIVGGPVAGALMGVAGSVIKKSNIFQRFLFGSEKNGQKGLINGVKDAWNRSKKEQSEALGMSSGAKGLLGSILGAGAGTLTASIFSNMGILGASLSPLGPIGGAILGLGAGIASEGQTFSEWLFGEEDGLDLGDGRTAKKQGVLGQVTNALKANFINPMKSKLEYLIDSTSATLEHNVLTPISLVAESVVGKVGEFVHNIGDSASSLLNKVADRIGKGFETLFSPIVNSVSNTLGKMADAASATFNTLVSLPANLIRAGIKALNFKDRIKDFFKPITEPVKDLVHRVGDVLTSGIQGMLSIGIKGISTAVKGLTLPVRWLGGLAGAGLNSASSALKNYLGDKFKDSKILGADSDLRQRWLNSEEAYKRDKEAINKQREINKRHDKNAQFIAKHTKNQFAEDTEEAREYLKRTNPKAYVQLMNMYEGKNTSIDEERHEEKNGASLGTMSSSDLSKANVDKLDAEGRQVYYLQGIFNILRGKEWNGDEQKSDRSAETESERLEREKEERAKFDDPDRDTTGYTTASRGMGVKEYLRHSAKSIHNFFNDEKYYTDGSGNVYSPTIGGKYDVYDSSGKYVGQVTEKALPSGLTEIEDKDGKNKLSFANDWKKTLGKAKSGILDSLKRSFPKKGGEGGFGEDDEESGALSKLVDAITEENEENRAKLESTKKRQDALAKAREAGNTAAELQAKADKEEEEEEQEERHRAMLEATKDNSDATREHNKEWSSIFGKTGLITLGLLAGIAFLKSQFPKLLDGLQSILGAIGQIGGGAISEAIDQAMFTEEHKTRTNGNNAGEEAAYLFNEMTGGNLFTDKDGNVVGRTDSLGQFTARRLLNFKFADQVSPFSSKFNKAEKAVYSKMKKGGSYIKSGMNKAGQWLSDANTIADLTAEYGDEAYDLAKGKGQKLVSKGMAAVKQSSAGKMVSKAATSADNVLSTVKSYIKEFFNFIKTKLGAKTGKTIGAKAMGEVTEEAIESGLEKGWKSIGGKITARLTSGASGAALTAGLSEVGFATLGAINGASGTAKLFHVDSSQVDGTMINISSVFGALAGTTVGGIIDLVFTLLSPILGFDILNNLAVGLYNFLVGGADSEKAVKLQSAQEAFEGAYLDDRKNQLEPQYNAMIKAGLLSPDVTLDMFITGVENGTYEANYTSFDDYNAQKNASLGDKIISGGAKVFKGIGNTAKAGWEWLAGSEKESYTDSNGTKYIKNKDGMYDVITKDGTNVGAISVGAIPKDAKKSVERTKNVFQRAGDGLATLGSNLSKGWVQLSDTFHTKLEETGKNLSEMGSTLMTGFSSMGSSFMDAFKKLSGYGSNLMGDTKAFIDTLKGYTDNDTPVDSMKSLKMNGADQDPVRAMISPIISNVMGVYVNIVRGVKGLGKQMGELLGGAVQSIADVLGIDVDGITSKVSEVSDAMVNLGTNFGDWAGEQIDSFKDWISDIGDGIVEWIEDLFGGEGGKGGFGTRLRKPGGMGTYYSQNDPRWKNAAYNVGEDSATMGEAGCGPTAMAMAASDVTGMNINPMQMASLAKATGNRDETGTNWRFINESSRALGLNSRQALNPSAQYISDQLDSGNPVVLSGQKGGYGQSPYTTSGHYVVAVGKDNQGNVIINDPRGRDHSGLYNLNDVASETGSAWSFGGNGRRTPRFRRGGMGPTAHFQNAMVADGGGTRTASTTANTNSVAQWVSIVKAVKQAMAAPQVGYSQSRYIDITVGGRTLKARTDCSGFTTACLKFFGVVGDGVNLTSYNYAKTNDSTLLTTGFTPMGWSGWNALQEGDIIAKDGHVEIFAYNDGNSHYVYNCGSNASCNNPNATKSGYSSYTTVWRPGGAGASAITSYAASGTAGDATIAGGGTQMSTWDKLVSATTGFFSEFGARALGGLMTGDWSNTDYSNVWNNVLGTGTTGTSYTSSGTASDMAAVATGNSTARKGDTVTLPSNLGTSNTFMGWQMITSPSSQQYKLRQQAGQNFDANGYGKINGRYTVATTSTYGKVGDYIDINRSDGSVLKAVIADIKNQSDPGCNQWGHDNGQTVVEFVVNKDKWYNKTNGRMDGYNIISSTDPGKNRNSVVSITNQGSYFEGGSGGFGNRASIKRANYYRPVTQKPMIQGGRGTVNYGSMGTINSRASQNQYSNYVNSSEYVARRKTASVNELLITVIDILSDISGNTRISSDKLDLLKNLQSGGGNAVIVNGGSTNHNVTNAFGSTNNSPSKSDTAAMRIASGSAY